MERFKPERNGPMLEEWKRKSWKNKRSKKAQERPSEVDVPPWNGGGCAKIRKTEEESGEMIAEQEIFPSLERLQCMQEDSTEEEEMKQQKRMMIMKDLTKKIRSKGRMDDESRWWVSELLAAGCEKAWIHTGWEDTVQKWYKWLEEMKKKDEKEQMEEMHEHKVAQMIKSTEGSAGLLHRI